MTNAPKIVAPPPPVAGKTLSKLLGDTQHVKALVDECAQELSSVNTVLTQPPAAQDAAQTIDSAIELSASAESKAQLAAEKLVVVNHALASEVHVRHTLETQLESVTRENEESLHASFHDALTGLPNRALFNDRLEHGLAQAKRHGFTLAVMFMDLDGFKAINDAYGHAVGDALLQTVADRLLENTREDDTVSRYGGDEFLYLLMSFDDEGHVLQIAEKIANGIEQPCRLTVGDVMVKVSIGISVFPKNGSTAPDLIECADAAMYQAKRARLSYVFA